MMPCCRGHPIAQQGSHIFWKSGTEDLRAVSALLGTCETCPALDVWLSKTIRHERPAGSEHSPGYLQNTPRPWCVAVREAAYVKALGLKAERPVNECLQIRCIVWALRGCRMSCRLKKKAVTRAYHQRRRKRARVKTLFRIPRKDPVSPSSYSLVQICSATSFIGFPAHLHQHVPDNLSLLFPPIDSHESAEVAHH